MSARCRTAIMRSESVIVVDMLYPLAFGRIAGLVAFVCVGHGIPGIERFTDARGRPVFYGQDQIFSHGVARVLRLLACHGCRGFLTLFISLTQDDLSDFFLIDDHGAVTS